MENRGLPDSHVGFPHEVPAEFITLARATCPPNPVICDIGSRDALDGIYLCQALQAAECHIFEPNPPAVQLCQANIALYGRGHDIFFNPVAVADTLGSIAFLPVNPSKSDNKDIGFSSILPVNPAYASAHRGSVIQERITVRAITLDRYFEGHQKQPDLLWIDVEGAEKLVLKGAQRTLKHVTLIHIEVSFRAMQIGKPLFWELDSFLRSRGFRLARFVGVSRVKAILTIHKLLPNPPWRWNAVYWRKDSPR